jgi:SAM-dependent methyltransferase
MGDPSTYDQIVRNLRQSYDRMAEERDRRPIPPWKIEERQRFLSLLQEEGKSTLLEIGAGTGVHSKFFQDKGLQVTSTDLSPRNVELCRQKGLTAHVMDFLNLEFPDCSFDALYSLNCLIHVPRVNLPRVLQAVRAPLKFGGLFYLGAYGGKRRQGVWPEDHSRPKRFFSFLPDEQIKETTARFFELIAFRQIPLEREPDLHFQSLILRRSPDVG